MKRAHPVVARVPHNITRRHFGLRKANTRNGIDKTVPRSTRRRTCGWSSVDRTSLLRAADRACFDARKPTGERPRAIWTQGSRGYCSSASSSYLRVGSSSNRDRTIYCRTQNGGCAICLIRSSSSNNNAIAGDRRRSGRKALEGHPSDRVSFSRHSVTDLTEECCPNGLPGDRAAGRSSRLLSNASRAASSERGRRSSALHE